MIRNTEDDAKDPVHALLFIAAATGPGGTSRAIEEQEKAGQAQVVNSDQLPTNLYGQSEADFEALGFTFGDLDPSDPLFRPATLPDGWKREASDVDMWSYIVDERGRRRVSVFYKAAFYDRRAHAGLLAVADYVHECARTSKAVITDDVWATPAAIVEAARDGMELAARRGARYTETGDTEWAAEEQAKVEQYATIIARFETAAGA
ncbi:MAG TPA: hypothetical protein VFH77_17385 [Streptomyces sp.]|nr:hypothetical protein [Streptomyces sp.]